MSSLPSEEATDMHIPYLIFDFLLPIALLFLLGRHIMWQCENGDKPL